MADTPGRQGQTKREKRERKERVTVIVLIGCAGGDFAAGQIDACKQLDGIAGNRRGYGLDSCMRATAHHLLTSGMPVTVLKHKHHAHAHTHARTGDRTVPLHPSEWTDTER